MSGDLAPRPVQVVGAALLDDLERPTSLLVARRSAPEALNGLWEFPGGKTEPGESDQDALLRELREELGVEAVLDREVPGPHPQGWVLGDRMALRLFTGVVASGRPAPLQDHSELRWVSLADPDAVLNLPWIPADLPIVHRLLDMLGARPAGTGGVN